MLGEVRRSSGLGHIWWGGCSAPSRWGRQGGRAQGALGFPAQLLRTVERSSSLGADPKLTWSVELESCLDFIALDIGHHWF